MAEGGSESPDVGISEVWRSFAYEGLTLRGDDGRPQPRLASQWRVSDDGLRWTISLKPGIRWHDGRLLDASGAAEALQRAVANQSSSPLHPGLGDIRQIAVAGSDTIELQLDHPSAFVIDDLDVRLQRPQEPAPPLGTGPFMPTSITLSEVRMRAHARYHEGVPAVSSLIVSAHPTIRQAWADLLRGELDALWNVSSDAIEFLNDETIETRSFPRRYVYVLAFNAQQPQLRNPVVRRALNSAIDRQSLIDTVLDGQGRPAWSPVWPEHWAYDRSASPFAYDPSLTKAALAGAGFPASPPSRRLRLSCLVPQGFATVERLALSLQRSMHDVGVDLSFESVSLVDMEARMAHGRFDAVLLDLLSGPSLSRVYSFWRSPGTFQGLNVFGYKDAEVDDALDRLRRSANESAIRAATNQLQRGFARNPPGIFIAWSERSRAVSRRIEVPTEPGFGPFQPVWHWKVRAAHSAPGVAR